MIREINRDFDKHNSEPINWEDHFGLCHTVAREFVAGNSKLAPYFDDIVEDLKAKLWECARPENFDPSRGIRFSTYAVTAMQRMYFRICSLYLGYNPRNKYKHRHVGSLNYKDSTGTELHDQIASKRPDQDVGMDTEIARKALKSLLAADELSHAMLRHSGINRNMTGAERAIARRAREKIVKLYNQGNPAAKVLAKIAGLHDD